MEIKDIITNGLEKSSKVVLTIVLVFLVLVFLVGFMLGAVMF